MNNRSSRRILFSLSQDFVCDWSRITLAKRDVLHQVRQRIALAPTKINVRQFAGFIAQEEQESRDGIRYGGRNSPENSVPVHFLAANLQYAGKLRCVTGRHFKE